MEFHPNAAQVAEYDAFEDVLFSAVDNLIDKLFGSGKIGAVAKKAIKSNNFVTEHIADFNEKIFIAMKENGLMDSKITKEIISKYKPQLNNFISIPNENFRLKDIALSVYDILFGGAL